MTIQNGAATYACVIVYEGGGDIFPIELSPSECVCLFNDNHLVAFKDPSRRLTTFFLHPRSRSQQMLDLRLDSLVTLVGVVVPRDGRAPLRRVVFQQFRDKFREDGGGEFQPVLGQGLVVEAEEDPLQVFAVYRWVDRPRRTSCIFRCSSWRRFSL